MTQPPSTVALFVTCLVDMFRPTVGEATVSLLEGQGIQVEFPFDQTCCGAPAYHGGWPDEGATLARRWIEIFEPYEAVVSPSAACVATVREGYPRLLADDEGWHARAVAIGARTYELSEFLVDVLGVAHLGARFQGKLTYQPACHLLRTLGIDSQPRTLLEHVEGAELAPLAHEDSCCGFGGLFSIKLPQISGAMAERKARAIERTEADLVVTCEAGCLFQMDGVLSRRKSHCRAIHLAELLAGISAPPETG